MLDIKCNLLYSAHCALCSLRLCTKLCVVLVRTKINYTDNALDLNLDDLGVSI